VIRAIDLVVPVHDEEAELGRCIRALRAATLHPRLAGIEVQLVIVLDSCSDRSGDVAEAALRGFPGARVVECAARSAGRARGVGAEALRRALPARDPGVVWLATTDADTRVPPDWLARQLELADRGADAIAGIVEIDDWHEQPAAVRRAFTEHYRADPAGTGHAHVHGANLGVRAAALTRAGGMPAVALAEDHRLVERLVASGVSVVRTTDVRVRTSARREGRAEGGFSDLLRALGAAAGSPAAAGRPRRRTHGAVRVPPLRPA
jgi:GT2 family glycosyltransferase